MSLENLFRLYNKKHSKKNYLNRKEAQGYSVSTLDTAKILSLYKLRNDIYKEKKNADNINFKKLIEALESYKQQKVLMHVFNINDKPRMILTNVVFTEVIAEL